MVSSDGIKISDGEILLKFCLNDITVVGKSCKLVADKTNNKQAPSWSPFWHSIVVAFIPDGVAIPPSPNRFAPIFMDNCFLVCSSVFLKSLSIISLSVSPIIYVIISAV